jgi:hypothetical protein
MVAAVCSGSSYSLRIFPANAAIIKLFIKY